MFKSQARRNDLIAMLRVPTYFNFQKCYFVDVLNMLSRYVCETDFLKERISQVKTLIKQSGGTAHPTAEEAFDDMYAGSSVHRVAS